jgi:rare lipoprotein A
MAITAAGRPRANGSNYALAAAHRTTLRQPRHGDKANDRSVKVRITDRGPFIKGGCIDLSRAAANAIGMGGIARVTVR